MVAIGNSITAPKDSWAWITAQHFDMELTNLAVSGAQWTDYQGTTVDTNPKPVYDGVHTNNVISNQVKLYRKPKEKNSILPPLLL